MRLCRLPNYTLNPSRATPHWPWHITMPVFAFTVGSMGDIFTAITLVAQITKVLIESTDSTNEHKFLAAELTTFTDTLKVVDRRLQSPALRVSERNALIHAVSTCNEILSAMKHKMENTGGSSGRSRGSNGMWSILPLQRAMRWVLLSKQEMEDYKKKLSSQWACMNTILETSNRCCTSLPISPNRYILI